MRDRQRGYPWKYAVTIGRLRLRCGCRRNRFHLYLPLTIIAIPKRRIGPQIIDMLDMMKNADNGSGQS